MNWFTNIPLVVQILILALAFCGLAGVLGLGFYALKRGGRIKAGAIEIDADDDNVK
jgi:divalent metal cation (Fe/Co/Zn/Cd) transporter